MIVNGKNDKLGFLTPDRSKQLLQRYQLTHSNTQKDLLKQTAINRSVLRLLRSSSLTTPLLPDQYHLAEDSLGKFKRLKTVAELNEPSLLKAREDWRAGLKTKFPGLADYYYDRANPTVDYKSTAHLKGNVETDTRVFNNLQNGTGIHNEPRKTSLDRVIANRGPFTFNPNPINGIGVRSPLPLSAASDKYHPKTPMESFKGDLTKVTTKDPNGKHLTPEEINKDVTDSIEKRTEERRKLPFIKSLFASKIDENADRLTASYSGFKTDLFDKEITDASGNKIYRPQLSIFPPDNPSTGSRFAYNSGYSHGAKTPWLDQRTSPITGLEGDIESYSKSELPKQLKGVGNLDNEADLFKFRAAYDQDLMNDRLGKRANYVNLTNDDIFQSSIRNTDIGNGGRLNAATMNAADTGYGMKQHLLHSGTLSAANPRSLKYGYGMGWGNAWRASRTEHLYRATAVVNPLSRGNLSTMGEMLGRVSTRDRLNFAANPSLVNRFMNVIQPAAVAGLLGYGMVQMQDPGELLTNFVAPAAAIYGGRVGLAMGAMVTPAKTAANWGLLRGAGMALGSTLGFTAGLTAASLVGMGLSSATSNDSSIRKFANSLNKTEIYTPQFDNRQTLTARQQALHKLSKSGLNDRALLLGNEAAALRGLI